MWDAPIRGGGITEKVVWTKPKLLSNQRGKARENYENGDSEMQYHNVQAQAIYWRSDEAPSNSLARFARGQPTRNEMRAERTDLKKLFP